jgi:hypothetical protein
MLCFFDIHVHIWAVNTTLNKIIINYVENVYLLAAYLDLTSYHREPG